jgi:hypothetical protein
VQGELFVVFELWFGGLRSLLEHSLSQICRVVALAYGVRDLSSSSDLALCLCLAFGRLLEFFLLFVSFLFLFSRVTICVCC